MHLPQKRFYTKNQPCALGEPLYFLIDTPTPIEKYFSKNP
jgi:hypothetical protein